MLGSFTNTLSSVVFVNDKSSSCKNQFGDINTGEIVLPVFFWSK